MNKLKTLFAAIAIAVGAAVVGFVAAPLNASASTAAGEIDIAAERIGVAFALVDPAEAAAQVRAAAVQAAKGDLPESLACAGQTWRRFKADCLVTADGSPVPEARFITVGSQVGKAETVLLRIPAELVASR
jgi:hypothetical protein